jgi:hypothetical protein
MDESEDGAGNPDDGAGLASRRAMGLRRLGDELRRARGTMTQQAAATHFAVAYSTLCAIEQGQDRNYQSHTLHQFDAMIGKDAWIVYSQPDVAGYDVPAASAAALDELRARVDELDAALGALAAGGPANRLEGLAAELTDDELAEVIAFAHWVLARRRGTG